MVVHQCLSLQGSDFKFRGDPQLMQLIKRLSDLKTKAKAKENIVEVNSQIAEIEENIKHLLEVLQIM